VRVKILEVGHESPAEIHPAKWAYTIQTRLPLDRESIPKNIEMAMDKQLLTQIIIPIVTALVIAFLLWQGAAFRKSIVLWWRSLVVYRWLKMNSHDEPGESHKTVDEICEGTRLSPDEVVESCRRNRKIFRSDRGNYSIWRREEQSVYEKHGIRFL
jgi:hypothetical protein